MARRPRQLRVRNPQIFLLLSLLACPHGHARILRTTPRLAASFLRQESRLSPRPAKQRIQLEAYARGRSIPARLVSRARIVLLAASGIQDLKIAHQLRMVPRTVARWRSRFLRHGIPGLQQDAPRPGRPRHIDDTVVRQVVEKTTREKPPQATHWSIRRMAAAVGISEARVRRIWRGHGLKPHRVDSFKLSNDPHFVDKLEDIAHQLRMVPRTVARW